jgi:hypothetical protein
MKPVSSQATPPSTPLHPPRDGGVTPTSTAASGSAERHQSSTLNPRSEEGRSPDSSVRTRARTPPPAAQRDQSVAVNLNFLRIPLGMLSGIDHINEFSGLSDERLRGLEAYDKEELAGILASLASALKASEFDFKPFLPPGVFHSNQQIHSFLSKVQESMLQHQTP